MVEEAKKMVVLTTIIESLNLIICIYNNGLKLIQSYKSGFVPCYRNAVQSPQIST